MSIKDIKLRKGIVKEKVNNLIGEWLTLEDDIYLGANYKHMWKCMCGNLFERTWRSIKQNEYIDCGCIKYNQQEQRYKYEAEKTGEYEYIRSFRKGDTLPNGEIIGYKPYIQIKHKYCGSIYTIRTDGFINRCDECSHCCGSYENSFAHYIEQELGEPLEKYWDFEKNTVNPYHINKGSRKKVWIKCTEKDYHGSYETLCYIFKLECRCSYCNPSGTNPKVHPLDSFAQYHIDNTDKDFLIKYWSDKNTVDPWSITPYSNKKVWIKCQENDYHNDNGGYEIVCNIFTKGGRCGYCHPSGKKPKIHPFDSFGYKHFDKVMSWHPDNDISPFRVSPSCKKKFKFICPDCGYVWPVLLNNVSNGQWCPQCASSKGEKRITKWLRLNNIDFIPQKTYSNLFGLGWGNLSYDFYLPDYNLLIEYQGRYHDGSVSHQTEEDFDKQQEHDRRKREYAKDNNIELLEIWYWDFDNIEEILKNELDT